jgi:hypothetical protein
VVQDMSPIKKKKIKFLKWKENWLVYLFLLWKIVFKYFCMVRIPIWIKIRIRIEDLDPEPDWDSIVDPDTD